MSNCSFHLFDFLEPAHVPLAAVERRAEEGANELRGEVGADHAGPEAEDVHVVVLDTLMRGIGVVTEAGSYSADLVGGDGGADARAADEDAALSLARGERLA